MRDIADVKRRPRFMNNALDQWSGRARVPDENFVCTKILAAGTALPRDYNVGCMLTINITWEYFLGILGSLIALAYYANGRLTRIETNYQWLSDTVRDLAIRIENISARAFESSSPSR